MAAGQDINQFPVYSVSSDGTNWSTPTRNTGFASTGVSSSNCIEVAPLPTGPFIEIFTAQSSTSVATGFYSSISS
jgi:hypothetical protein